MLLGFIESHPVFFHQSSDEIFCKEVTVPVRELKYAYNQSLDRYTLDRSNNLIFRKLDANTFSIGCLSVSIEQFKSMYNKVKQTKLQDARAKKAKSKV